MRIALAILSLLAASEGVVLVQGGRKVGERDLLRGYAFADCMAVAYKGTPVERDANRVAELYREVGRTNRQAVYKAIDDAASALDPARPAKIDNVNLAIMNCLEFYEGTALSKAIAIAGGPRR
jgi:Type VI secretion system (T6SS), amidase immunity protein